jgi:excisionase family DNA binding protein
LKDANPEPNLLTVRDLSSILNCGRTKAWELVNTRQVRTIRVGRLVRIHRMISPSSCANIALRGGSTIHEESNASSAHKSGGGADQAPEPGYQPVPGQKGHSNSSWRGEPLRTLCSERNEGTNDVSRILSLSSGTAKPDVPTKINTATRR